MKKIMIFSVAFVTTTLLCLSCQKEEVVAPMDVATTKSENVQKGKTAYVSFKDAIQIATEATAMLDEGATTRSAVKRRVDLSKVKYHVTPQTRSGEGGDTLYYVVNYADSAGFALVSTSRADGDPLIAVTEQGNFTPGEETGNPGFDMYISLLNDRPSPKPEGPTSPIDTTNHGPNMIEDYDYIETYLLDYTQITPLVETKWGQESPYNMFCFTEQTREQAKAGCLPIAMAQIMSYYEYPVSYNRTHDESNVVVATNWSNIKQHLILNYTTCHDHTDMAHLIKELGYRMGTDYGVDNSSTSPFFASFAFANLGYTLRELQSYDFVPVKNDLDNYRPVLMTGVDPDQSAHAWVIDGYRSYKHMVYHYTLWSDGSKDLFDTEIVNTNYVHINWGWNSQCDGYFTEGVFKNKEPIELDSNLTIGETYNYTTELYILPDVYPNN